MEQAYGTLEEQFINSIKALSDSDLESLANNLASIVDNPKLSDGSRKDIEFILEEHGRRQLAEWADSDGWLYGI